MNYTIPPKKMIIINILDILKRYTDENHKLSQKQIAEILKNEYNTTVERKTILLISDMKLNTQRQFVM